MGKTSSGGDAYKKAGVDINEGDFFVQMVRRRIAQAWPGMEKEIGGFAGEVNIPPMVTRGAFSTDGVGTKLIIAAITNNFIGVGHDAVAMSVVDNYVAGLRPRYVLDYFATGKLIADKHIAIINSVIDACKLAQCKLIGGETAEMPRFFRHDWFVDLVTFSVAFDNRPVEFFAIRPGQKVFALPSFGLASNGYSLVRNVFGLTGAPSVARRKLFSKRIFGKPLQEVLLEPTPIWIQAIEDERQRGLQLSGMVHITGGGLVDNPPRVLPDDMKMIIDRSTWRRPEIFGYIQEKHNISVTDMDRTFNNGLMMLCILDSDSYLPVNSDFKEVGVIELRLDNEPQVQLIGSY